MELVFVKSLKKSHVKDRCPIPTKCLKQLPASTVLPVRTGSGSVWRLRCDVRKKGRYLKPVLSGDWRRMVAREGLKFGDEIKLLKYVEVDEHGECYDYYRVVVKKAILVLLGKTLCYAQPYII